LIKVKGGTSIYPPAIENLLVSDSRVEEYVIEACLDDDGRQVIRIDVALADDVDQDSTCKAIQAVFAQRFRFRPAVRARSRGELEKRIHVRGKRKPARFQDLRSQ